MRALARGGSEALASRIGEGRHMTGSAVGVVYGSVDNRTSTDHDVIVPGRDHPRTCSPRHACTGRPCTAAGSAAG